MSFLTCMAVIFLTGADDQRKDLEALKGTWQLTAWEADGKAKPDKEIEGGKLNLKGDAYDVKLAGIDAVTGTMIVDGAKDPKTIDITDAVGPNKDKTCLGIYELKGDVFRVAFAVPGKPRPTTFTTEPSDGRWVHVWKRMKE